LFNGKAAKKLRPSNNGLLGEPISVLFSDQRATMKNIPSLSTRILFRFCVQYFLLIGFSIVPMHPLTGASPPLPPLPPDFKATPPLTSKGTNASPALPGSPETKSSTSSPAPTPAGGGLPTARPVAAPQNPTFELLDGDRVVFLGDTLIEREQTYGYVESRLTVRWPDRHITFRNLGWSADTVLGQSRVSFDWNKSEEERFQQLKKQIAAVNPTVAILGYGMASSFAGEAGLPKFRADLNKLIETIQELAKDTKVRFMLLSPIRHENLGPPLPDPVTHNKQLELYSKAIQQMAQQREIPFINLFERLRDGTAAKPIYHFTDNGIHLTAYGYSRLADVIEMEMRWAPNWWRLGITPEGKIRRGSLGMEISDLQATASSVRFSGRCERLVFPRSDGGTNRFATISRPNFFQFAGINPGSFILKADGQEVYTAMDTAWKAGQVIEHGPDSEQAEQLRQVILKKNELFFHRWRPENQTYLFGFRKYEQGQNAREIPQFDPLVQAEEEKIARLRKPVKRTYQLFSADPSAAAKPSNGIQKNEQLAGESNSTPGNEAAASSEDKTHPFTPQPIPQFELAPDLEINLFAENPQLAKPIQMNFDPQGRLWVASSSVYPQIEPGQKANDKILILEDTDGDGKADKSTIFADGLLIPTGVEPGDRGCYVGQSTELLHFEDTNGDGKADKKRIVLSGFGTEDTHHILHTLRWGPDGQLSMNQSIYIHTHTETPHGVVRLNSGGVLQLDPVSMRLEVLLRGFCNPWGHHFDQFGQSFVTDGAGFQGISWGMPGAMYFTYADGRRLLDSISPGNYPKFCGLEMVYSQHFPEDWQGTAVTCDFRANRVVRFGITEQGSGYAAKELPDLLRTTNTTFRPIDVKLGPDGALYIADWANPIINHGEVDFRDPRRDHVHGRIWRVTFKGRPLLQKPVLVTAANSDLLDQLLSPNGYNRQQSRRVLTERGTNILSDLTQWSSSHSNEKAQLEALWMYQSVHSVEPLLLKKLLTAQDGRIRAAATRVLSAWKDSIENSLELMAERITDEHPRVRVEAVRAASKISSVRSADLVLSILDRPMDPFLDYAVWLSINDLARPWTEAVQMGAWKPDGREHQLLFGLKAIEPSLAAPVLAQFLTNKPLSRDGSGSWIELIGQAGGPNELQHLFDQLVQKQFDPPSSVRALVALSEANRLRNLRPPGGLAQISELFSEANDKIQSAAVRLAGAWKIEAFSSQFLKLAGHESTPAEVRDAAFAALRDLGGRDVVSGLHALGQKTNPYAIRRQAVLTLAPLDLEQALPEMIDVIMATSPETDALALWRSLLDIKGAAAAITRALPNSGLPTVPAKAGMRAAREGGRKEPALVLALARGAGLEQPEQEFGQWEFLGLAERTLREGDPTRGEAIYRRTELGCITCHSIGGAGGKVGPDMTSIGASSPLDYVIESILVPNKKVKEGYSSLLIQTKDDQEFSGILIRESNEELVLRNAANQEVSVPKNDIKSRANGASLMPSGLVDTLTSNERLDLFRFLSELGKPGPYDASKGNVARAWKIFNGSAQTDEERLSKGDLKVPGWAPVYATVDGRLPKQDLEAQFLSASNHLGAIYATTQFQVSNGGRVKLKLEAPAKTEVWIDGKAVEGTAEISAELAAGTRTIVVRLNPRDLSQPLRLESNDGTFLMN
jgi:putative heme-binding domain-containing protein